jgi:hypothetical protein
MELIQPVFAPRTDMDDRKRGRGQDFIDKFVASPGVWMIKPDRYDWTEILVADHKIDVLPIDALNFRIRFRGRLNHDQFGQTDFGKHRVPRRQTPQNIVNRAFGCGKELVPA